jgi:hypothetical protein
MFNRGRFNGRAAALICLNYLRRGRDMHLRTRKGLGKPPLCSVDVDNAAPDLTTAESIRRATECEL